jgi:hypothetical protein
VIQEKTMKNKVIEEELGKLKKDYITNYIEAMVNLDFISSNLV